MSTRLHQRPNTLPQTCLSTKLILAVTRRTIHCSHAADHTLSSVHCDDKNAQHCSSVASISAAVRLLQCEGMFRFDSTELANWEPAASMSLKMFDVGSGSGAGLFECLHGAVAIFATHDLAAFCKRFVEGAWEPAATHLHLALGHHRSFLLSRH